MPPTYTHPDLSMFAIVDALSASGFEVGAVTRRSRAVLDTFDGRLHSDALRLVMYGPPAGELVLSRADDPGSSARLAWGAAPSWPHELPPGPFRSRLAAVVEERALLPVLSITSRVRAARRVDRRGKTTAVVEIHDCLTVPGIDAAKLPSWVAEIVPVVGYDRDAETAAALLSSLGAAHTADDAIGVVAHAANVSLAGHRSSPTVPLAVDDDALSGFRRVLANLAATVDDNLDGTIADTDPEFLHELRVAVRRTRSVLGQGKSVLPPDVVGRYGDAFRWFGSITGLSRDLDVYLLGWNAYVSPLSEVDGKTLEPVRKELERRRRAAHRDLAKALRGKAAREILEGWRAWLGDPDVVADTYQPLGSIVVRRILKAQAKVLRDGRAISSDTPPERLHDLRKDAKKLRYLLECFGSLFAAKPRKAFVAQLKALQDNLGEHQDAEVHLAQIRELASDLHQRKAVDADVLLAMGRLSDHLDRRREQERDDFAERFAAYDTKANRQALERLVRSAADS